MFRAVIALALLAGMIAPATSAVADSLAFVAGINSYEKVSSLDKAVNDSESIAKTLDGLGYTVTLAKDVGRLEFKVKWDSFIKSVNPGDVVTFFFAGHGIEIQGINYLLAKDTPEKEQGEDVLRIWGHNFKILQQDLAARKPRLTIYVLDACRDNPYKGKRGLGGPTGVAVEKVEGAFVLYSAGDEQEALDALSEDDKDTNSVFTRRLLPMLIQQGLRIDDLAKRVSDQVADDAQTKYIVKGQHKSHLQRPAFYSGLSGQFCFAGCTTQESQATKEAKIPEAAEVWSVTNQTKSPAVLRKYIELYKGTIYALLAQARVDELEKPSQAVGNTSVAGPVTSATEVFPLRVSKESGKRTAFIAGNGGYKFVGPLSNSVSDARAVADRLKSLDYEVRTVFDADRRTFLLQWNQFLGGLTKDDMAFIYFAGHGLEVAGQNYLIPVDAKVEREADIEAESISFTQLLTSLKAKPLKFSATFLDACRDNPFATSVKSRGISAAGGLALIDNPINSFVMYSSGAGECGLDQMGSDKTGPFAGALLNNISTPKLSINELALRVRREVSEKAATIGHRQTPAYFDGLVEKVCLAGPCE